MNIFNMILDDNHDHSYHVNVTSGSGQQPLPSKNYGQEAKLNRLEDNLYKLFMINEALWELCSEQLKLTQKDLYDKLYEIDMRDGVLDGKNKRKSAPCPGCGRMISARHASCLYCGKAVDASIFTMD